MKFINVKKLIYIFHRIALLIKVTFIFLNFQEKSSLINKKNSYLNVFNQKKLGSKSMLPKTCCQNVYGYHIFHVYHFLIFFIYLSYKFDKNAILQ